LQSEVAKLTNEVVYMRICLIFNDNKLSKARKELDQKKQEHQQKITMAYSYLAKLLKKKDKLINSNVSKEERIYKMLSNHRKKVNINLMMKSTMKYMHCITDTGFI
jgi:predicted transcriptional regulator